jgi:hypothetical protein
MWGYILAGYAPVAVGLLVWWWRNRKSIVIRRNRRPWE